MPKPIRPLLFLQILFLFATQIPAQNVSTTEWVQLIPSDKLPKNIVCQAANNNLDLIKYHGKYYVAWRTAPTHFASEKTMLYLISSSNLQQWDYETEFHLGADMREPRFFILHDTLYFHFFEAGSDPLRFEPRHLWGTCTTGNGKWAPKWDSGLDNYVPWRFRTRRDTAYMSAYYGLHLYQGGHTADLRLFYSTDARHWKKLSQFPQVGGRSAEEGEFTFDDQGNLYGTVRMESIGAYVVSARAGQIANWKKVYTKHKYDSALTFNHHNEIYLVSRRNLDGDGRMARAWTCLPFAWQKAYNLARYSATRKTTSLWKINKETLAVEHLMDFPATGDCSFPGIAPITDREYLLMNYSSDIHGKPKNWIRGQLKPTQIYMTVLKFGE
ncbi:MAG: hypothetical protein H6581_13985 [Bacteroidia bacterium]|nr:hypothetical protein [Bacteroidia bacterium]